MKTTLWVMLFLCTSVLFAEVLFYDNFNRADGAVGNSWSNIGSATTAIENNAMKITSPNGTGIKRDFTSITSGIYYIQFDWKVVSTDWYADAFPTGLTTHLVIDSAGDLCYDLDGTMSDPVVLTHVGLGVFVNVRLKINLDSDVFSVWVNNNLLASDIPGVATSTFYRFSFRGMGSSTIQYVDNLVLMNEVAPNGLTAVGEMDRIDLAWEPSLFSDLIVYNIYRDTVSPASTFLTSVQGIVTEYIDFDIVPGSEHYYRIKAVQAGNVESAFSNEVMAHLQPQAIVSPLELTINIGSDNTDESSILINNVGGYTLDWELVGENPSLISDDGLTALMPFEGNADDISGNGHDGVVNGATLSSGHLGESNSAYHFEYNTYIQFNSTNLPSGNSPRTISAWFKADGVAPGSQPNWIIGYGNADAGKPCYFIQLTTDGRLYTQTGSWQDEMFSINTFRDNQWHLATLTWDGQTMCLYADGELEASQVISSGISTAPEMFSLGRTLWWSGDSFYIGSIDNVSVYNRALTSNEIARLYNDSLSPYFYLAQSQGNILSLGQDNIPIKAVSYASDPMTCSDTLYVFTNSSITPQIPIYVSVNIDIVPPMEVINLEVDSNSTDANQIGLTWTQNAVADSVVTYKVFRRGRDEATWRLVGTVPKTQSWFVDNQFTGLDSTYVYYRVQAVDWVGNLGPEGTEVIAALERFLAPSNVQIANVDNRDIHLTWSPVTQTISGLPGTPTCYVIYKSQYPSPISDFDFLGVSFAEEYTHQWALYFQPLNRLFYIVTAYGGNMSRINELMAQKEDWKYQELEEILNTKPSAAIK